MLITRSPLRISLGGGGTDLPSYYRDHGGYLISAAIDKYVYVTISRPFIEGVILKYSKIEKVDTVHSSTLREIEQGEPDETPNWKIDFAKMLRDKTKLLLQMKVGGLRALSQIGG